MLPLNIVVIEQEARKLRAAEMQRIRGLVSARLRVYGRLLSATVRAALTMADHGLYALLSWNPPAHRS